MGLYRIAGTAKLESGLNFVLTRSDEQFWNLTGTLTKPHVTPANQEISRTEVKPAREVKP